MKQAKKAKKTKAKKASVADERLIRALEDLTAALERNSALLEAQNVEGEQIDAPASEAAHEHDHPHEHEHE